MNNETRVDTMRAAVEALTKLIAACKAQPSMQGREFVDLGIEAHSALSLLRSALDEGGEPKGWKLVPVEPTEAMHVAAVRTIVRCTGNADFPPRVWRAMLAASPIAADTHRAVNPPEFQEATWGVDSVMRSCKSMAVSEYAFRQWAKDVGIVLAAGAALPSLTPAVPATPGGGLSTEGVKEDQRG